MSVLILPLMLSLAQAEPNVVLISMDTTRADAISCYGRLAGLDPQVSGPTTPVLDALAADGMRFEHFYSNAPTTLSSHATMLSGRDPHTHAVPRNGFPLHPAVPTLPKRLADLGYDTIGVIGAKALEADMGLNRGFRVYDDHTPVRRTAMFQATADNVVLRTLKAVDDRPDPNKPTFLFVHFYDPHAPYEAPPPFRKKFTPPGYEGHFADGMQYKLQPLRRALIKGQPRPKDVAMVNGLYQGEVAFTDHQIGVLLAGLRVRGLLDDALVVVTADHGEALHDSERFSYSHGSDVDDTTIHVPLIVRSYGDSVVVDRRVVQRQADMSGLAPTIERMLGLQPQLGDDFWQLVRPGPVLDVDGWPEHPTTPAFSEATRPFSDDTTQWNNAALYQSVRVGPHELRAAPALGVAPFVVDAPSGWFSDNPMLELLTEVMDSWNAKAPPFRHESMEEGTRAALEALGYLEPEE